MDDTTEIGYNPLEAKYDAATAGGIRNKFEKGKKRGHKRPDHHGTPNVVHGGSEVFYDKSLDVRKRDLLADAREAVQDLMANKADYQNLEQREKPVVVPPIPEKPKARPEIVLKPFSGSTPDPFHPDVVRERNLRNFGKKR